MEPIVFRIPFVGFPIHSYGLMMAIAFVVTTAYVSWRAARERIDPAFMTTIALWACISGIAGARVAYYAEFYHERRPVLVAAGEPYDVIEVMHGEKHFVREVSFADRPWYALLLVQEGGLVFFGGLISAGIAVVLCIVRENRRLMRAGGAGMPILSVCDMLAAGVPLGLAFGRIGCFLNGCCWGRRDGGHALLAVQFPRGSPAWSVHVERFGLPDTAACSYLVHATQLYEAAAAILIAAILALAWNHRRRQGQVLALLGVLYGPVRYVIEGFREHDPVSERTHLASWLYDPIAGAAMTNSQLASIAIFLVGVLAALVALRFGPPVVEVRASCPAPVKEGEPCLQ